MKCLAFILNASDTEGILFLLSQVEGKHECSFWKNVGIFKVTKCGVYIYRHHCPLND